MSLFDPTAPSPSFLLAIRKLIARALLRVARWVSPETRDDLLRLQVWNENLHEELRKERQARSELGGENRWLRAKVMELKRNSGDPTPLEKRKEKAN